ncbi:MAG: diguanylate cyclase [Ruminococcus sp.]|nr:diguanylate cyclase [Ruminococcus sp.]
MKEKKISTLSLILILQLVIMIVLSVIITATITITTKKNAIEHMQTITDERAHIILNYVENAEKTLTYYSKAEQVTNLLADPTNADKKAKAQAFTEDYSSAIDNVEGLWIGTWETECLAHTNPGTVGLVTRPKDKVPEKLKELQDAMKAAGDGVYNIGIIISPATGKQIVSMYKAVYGSDGNPIGFVGLGIFTDQLVSSLDALSIKGIENSSYSMVNVKDGKYIFNDDAELIDTVAENSDIQKLCEKYSGRKESGDGDFEYKKGSKKYVSIYSYMPEYGWLLMLDDTRKEVYSLTYDLRIYMVIFAAVLVGLMIVFSFITKKQQKVSEKLASAITKNNKTKESLYTAMFKDVLTEASNRIAFSMDMDKVKNAENLKPHYFIMFNITDFSRVNYRFGNEMGDWLLVRTVDMLQKGFKDAKIYRTGSDEFVIAADATKTSKEDIIKTVNTIFESLNATRTTPHGKQTFKFKAAIIKKSKDFNLSIVAVLKDMINNFRGTIEYKDNDKQ